MAANFAFWGISGQYSIEYTPIIALAFIDLIKIMRNWKFKSAFIYFSVILVIGTNLETKKNKMVSTFYDDCGFEKTSDNDYSQEIDILIIQLRNKLKIV